MKELEKLTVETSIEPREKEEYIIGIDTAKDDGKDYTGYIIPNKKSSE